MVMATLEDCIVDYEKEFVLRLKKYSKEDFSEFIDDHVENCRKLLEGKEDEDIVIADDPKAKAEKGLREARKNFYDKIREHKSQYNNWREAFANIFNDLGEYWKAIEPIIKAEQEVATNYKGFKDRVEKYRRFVNASIKQRKEMGYLCFPLEPLTERYTIKLNICTLKKEGGYNIRATKELNELLKNPELTIFGRDAPKSSRLHKYKLKDRSVSKQQGCFGLNRDGDIVVQYDGKFDGSIKDYERKVWDIKQGESKRLIPAFFDKDQGSASIYFGGKDRNFFKLEITLEAKIKADQPKTKSPQQQA